MMYREANIDEYKTICRQVRSRSVLVVCLMSLVIPVTVLSTVLSINMMIRKNYDRASFIVSTLLLVTFLIIMAVFVISFLKGFFKRISCINNHKYYVADCVVSAREKQRNTKHTHYFVTVSFPDGNEQKVMVSASVYSLAERGKRALLLKYDEPEGIKNKLPFEIAVIER
ncbi:MAG: hypothetical protein K5665_08140 [Saccharofermentans sp.]|nr:hypothetical protein [Saccharofermentans sp.]